MFRWCIGWSSQNFILLIFAPAFRMLQTVMVKLFRTHRTVTVLHQFLDSLAFPFHQSLYHLHTFSFIFLYKSSQIASHLLCYMVDTFFFLYEYRWTVGSALLTVAYALLSPSLMNGLYQTLHICIDCWYISKTPSDSIFWGVNQKN